MGSFFILYHYENSVMWFKDEIKKALEIFQGFFYLSLVLTIHSWILKTLHCFWFV